MRSRGPRGLKCAALVLAVLGCRPASSIEIEVTGSRVNLRTAPVEDAEVAGQVERGARLQVKALQEAWAEVVPPPHLSFWVHEDFVANGVVQPEILNVRSGPGVAHQRVGQVQRGDVLNMRGRFSEWIEIAPPPDTSLWISRVYVQTLVKSPSATPSTSEPDALDASEEAVAVTPLPEEMPEPAFPAKPSLPSPPADSPAVLVPARLPPAPADLTLNPAAEQGRITEMKGELARVGFIVRRPARYRLVSRDQGRARTLAYVRGDEERLAALVGRVLRVRGRTYEVRAYRYPLILGDQITLFP